MGKKICVYTCITGDYDNLHDITFPEKNVDYYCFTNNKKLTSKTWKIVQIEDKSLDNCRLARRTKILGHPIINDNYDICVWADADVIWKEPVTKFVKTFFDQATFAVSKHHARNSIHEEAVACLKYRKENKDIIQKTLMHYEQIGFPDKNGLYETTVFIRDSHDEVVKQTMKDWFYMVKNYSRRDQLSFTYATWKNKLKISPININVWNNNWFYTARHASKPTIEDCHIYYGDPNEEFGFEKYFVEPYKKHDDIYSINATIPNDTKVIEINPTDAVCIKYDDIAITPEPTHLDFYGAATYGGETAFCSGSSTIRVFGNFKKNHKFSFSIKLKRLTEPELIKLSENLWAQNSNLNNQNCQLTIENHSLKTTLDNIKNSKSYKLVHSCSKALKIFKK